MKKKALALALVLCMVIAMLPVSVFAAPVKQTAQIQPQGRIEDQSQLTIEPQALPELPAEPNAGKYKITAKVTKGSSHGEYELSAATADRGDKVYLMANPDDGYLVELGGSYEYRDYEMEIIYIGMDIYEITMPDGNVSLELKFVAAPGSNHSIKLSVNNTAYGTAEVSRTQAKEGESVLVAAVAAEGYYLDTVTAVDANGDDALGAYLGADENGVDYFEFIMPGTALSIELVFEKMVPHRITIDTHFEDEIYGTATVDRDYLMAGERFVLTLDLIPTVDVQTIDSRSDVGYVPITWFAPNQYEGIMPNCDLHIMVSIKKAVRTLTINVQNPELGDVDRDFNNDVGGTSYVHFRPYYEGYRGIIVDNGGVEDITWIDSDSFRFVMPRKNVTMTVSFVESQRPITLTVGKHGTATISHTKAEEGELITLTVTPDENYKVDKITGVDNITDNGDGTYTFPMPFRDVKISVSFKVRYHAVTASVETGLGGTASVSHEKAEEGDTITLTAIPEEGYRIAAITGVKDLQDNGDGTYTFAMPDEPVDVKVLFLRHENPFLDVNETHFFYDPVLWAVEEGITSGMTPNTFGPFAVCNRAQVVTFLWRAAGSPEPTTAENPFTDVPADSFYYKPVLWAVEKGITNGVSAQEFGPGLACNRAQVVTFLFRARNARLPENVVNPFEDVAEGDFFYAPVLWALENGVTTGADATHFNPVGQCQRAQVVTFLYRAKDLPIAYDLHWAIEGEGTVTLSHISALAGETVTATVIPAEGWILDRVWCESGTEITQISDTEFTFVMPDREETFHASIILEETPEEPDPTEPVDPSEPTDPVDPEPTEPAPEIPVDPEF